MTWPADIPFDPARKRYYLVGLDFHRGVGDYELLNKEELFFTTSPINGVRHPILSGTREYQIPGNPRPDTYGLPRLRNRPRLKVGWRNKPLDAYSLNGTFVSTRAKELLCTIDAEAFEFVECETSSRKGIEVEPYWMMSIIRPVNTFDEERSVFQLHKGIDGVTNEPYEGPYFSNLYDIHMRPDLVEGFHAFFLPRFPRHMIFDQLLADEWRARRFSGWTFTPLQPPAPKERRPGHMGRSNFVYWYEAKYRHQR